MVTESERLLENLRLIAGRVGKAKERIDMVESELNRVIQELKEKVIKDIRSLEVENGEKE